MANENRRIDGKKSQVKNVLDIIARVLLCCVLLFFMSITGYRFVKGFQYWRRNAIVKRGYEAKVQKLKQERDHLMDKVDKIRNNSLMQERLAREIGYIKPGETKYKFINKEGNQN